MTTQSPGNVQKTATETTTSKLFNDFSIQISRINNATEDLEGIGHRIANTNFPTPEQDKQPVSAALVQQDGILSELEIKINKFKGYNDRLEELVKKLSQLI